MSEPNDHFSHKKIRFIFLMNEEIIWSLKYQKTIKHAYHITAESTVTTSKMST